MGSLKSCAWVQRLGQCEKIDVDLDSAADIDCISISWAQKMNLKLYKKPYPLKVGGIGNTCIASHGAYWVRYRMTDNREVTREFYRPFLAVDRDSTESPLLIGMPGLEDMKVNIAFQTEGKSYWNFDLERMKPLVKIDGKI